MVKALITLITCWLLGMFLLLLGLFAGSLLGAVAAVAYRVFTELAKVL